MLIAQCSFAGSLYIEADATHSFQVSQARLHFELNTTGATINETMAAVQSAYSTWTSFLGQVSIQYSWAFHVQALILTNVFSVQSGVSADNITNVSPHIDAVYDSNNTIVGYYARLQSIVSVTVNTQNDTIYNSISDPNNFPVFSVYVTLAIVQVEPVFSDAETYAHYTTLFTRAMEIATFKANLHAAAAGRTLGPVMKMTDVLQAPQPSSQYVDIHTHFTVQQNVSLIYQLT